MCKADSYRYRAEELRTIAEQVQDKQAREALLKCAEEYDELAERAKTPLSKP